MPLRNYTCPWCENNFEQNVEYKTGGSAGRISKHKGCMSTPVVCTKCRRLIPVWKREVVKNSIGRKHIHIRG
jgi:hypothetical protein